MSQTIAAPDEDDRFRWLERRDADFPYYRGQPVEISTVAWIAVLLGVFLGFLVLTQGGRLIHGTAGSFLLAFLYWAIPLAVLALFAGRHWTALFRRLRGIDFVLMAVFAILNLAVTLVAGSLITQLTETTANSAVAGVAALDTADRVVFFARAAVQLVGEEVMTVLPFLAILYWLLGAGMGRKTAIVIATLIVALLFAAEHLPTYGWNVVQAVLGVGLARIVLLLPYIITKNLWVSAGAHILNDWMFFGVSILGASAAATTG